MKQLRILRHTLLVKHALVELFQHTAREPGIDVNINNTCSFSKSLDPSLSIHKHPIIHLLKSASHSKPCTPWQCPHLWGDPLRLPTESWWWVTPALLGWTSPGTALGLGQRLLLLTEMLKVHWPPSCLSDLSCLWRRAFNHVNLQHSFHIICSL